MHSDVVVVLNTKDMCNMISFRYVLREGVCPLNYDQSICPFPQNQIYNNRSSTKKVFSVEKKPKIFLPYYGRMKYPNMLFSWYLSFYGKKTFLPPLLLPKASIPYTHECTLRLTDQNEWVLPELTSTSALIKLLYPTPCFWASS